CTICPVLCERSPGGLPAPKGPPNSRLIANAKRWRPKTYNWRNRSQVPMARINFNARSRQYLLESRRGARTYFTRVVHRDLIVEIYYVPLGSGHALRRLLGLIGSFKSFC